MVDLSLFTKKEQFLYNLKVLYSHFSPMAFAISGTNQVILLAAQLALKADERELRINNFLGHNFM